MKTEQNFWLLYFLLVIAQSVISNYFQFSPYSVISILPAMVMCIPLQTGTSVCMIIAFASGLGIDFLSEGVTGLNAAAVLPVALTRKQLIRSFLGEDIIARQDSFSFQKNGASKVMLAMSTAVMIFLIIYIILDGAGTRPLWFNAARFGISMAVNVLLAAIITRVLTTDDRR